MHKEKELKNSDELNEELKNTGEAAGDTDTPAESEAQEEDNACEDESSRPEESIEELRKSLDEKCRQNEELFGALQRAAAEFDNYKKRTAREKEALYCEALTDVVAAFLPVTDNLERAVAASGEEEGQSLHEGVQMVFRQMKEVMTKLGVEEIEAVGGEFDPQLHNAVMHVEDETVGHNVVVEEFQKGYRLKEKVIRHSMVKVAN